ncbi:MAG: DNA-formamidopyrimidine glycosylase [Caedibacter sp. 37-49]|nr:MAG: DNA-formamidopyrimidine glycosylase [Caedibacter sp. 37-49]
MPELPEVESIRVNLEKHILNQTIENVVVSNRKLRWPIQDNFEVLLKNHTVKALERRAKYILLSFKQSNFILVWHLGMSGRVQILTPKELVPRKVHDHVEIKFYSGLILRFHDPRRFGAMLLVPSQDLPSFSLLNSLGIEPFDDNFSSSLLLKLIKHKSLTLKTVLLNQKIIAGLGNIYVCEALHQAKLSPLRLAKTLSVLEAEALVRSIQEVLKKAIAAGGSTLRDHRQPNGSKGSFQENFKVYGREGEPCFQCNQSSIERIVQSNRSTFYCKECQK